MIPLRLFQAVGLELEYMIVDRQSLSVRPLADEVLKAQAGSYVMDVELGHVAWSNELALHVIEMKTNGPTAALAPALAGFQDSVRRMEAILAPMGARLMPTAMHPWMDPYREMRLWPHEDSPVYRAFDRIFDCRGHGWANLQSMHVNLPFGDDEEFGRLHAAIRLVLPLLPALAASSPLRDGRLSGKLDTRVDVYRGNAARVPSVCGLVVPERVFSRHDYEGQLLERIYTDLAPHDPEGILRHEWVNARGCIARFDRDAIEIRLLDVQECPAADLAVCAAVVGVVRALVEERLCDYPSQQGWDETRLHALLLETIQDADAAVVDDAAYREALGYRGGACTAGQLWRHLLDTTADAAAAGFAPQLQTLLEEGCLSRRITRALGPGFDRTRLEHVYRELCECLAQGRMFHAA